MGKINLSDRYDLEWSGDELSKKVIHIASQQPVGDFWRYDGVWAFILDDGRSQCGGFEPVLKALRSMLRAEPIEPRVEEAA